MATVDEFKIKQGDLLRFIRARCVDADGVVQDLTGTSVRFHMKDSDGVVLIDQPAVIELPVTDGWVHYEWQAGDTDTAGRFKGEFECLLGSKPLTFPNGGDIKIHIFEQVA